MISPGLARPNFAELLLAPSAEGAQARLPRRLAEHNKSEGDWTKPSVQSARPYPSCILTLPKVYSLRRAAAHPSVQAVTAALLSRGSTAGSQIAVLAGCASLRGGRLCCARSAAGNGSVAWSCVL